MKFSSSRSFLQHLEETVPEPFLWVVSPEEYRRKHLIAELLIILKPSWVTRFSGLDTPVSRIQEELWSPSLLGGTTVVIFDLVDKVKGLPTLLAPLPPHTHLVLGSATFKSISDLYQKGKKEMVVIDVSDEKPWERDRRLLEWMRSRVRDEQKEFEHAAASLLLEWVGPDMQLLEQEVDKLLCYVGDRLHIQTADVETIATRSELATSWQLSEGVVWDRPVQLGLKGLDPGFMIPFIGQLRYHFQLGCQVAELVEVEGREEELHRRFSHIRRLSTYVEVAKRRRSSFFFRGLAAVYELEFASRDPGVSLLLLFDVFQGVLYAQALSTSEPVT